VHLTGELWGKREEKRGGRRVSSEVKGKKTSPITELGGGGEQAYTENRRFSREGRRLALDVGDIDTGQQFVYLGTSGGKGGDRIVRRFAGMKRKRGVGIENKSLGRGKKG